MEREARKIAGEAERRQKRQSTMTACLRVIRTHQMKQGW
jgi:hypothetical protein